MPMYCCKSVVDKQPLSGDPYNARPAGPRDEAYSIDIDGHVTQPVVHLTKT